MDIKGPCVLCGATNYQLSYGGLTICPSCDCGIPPEVRELRDENAKLQNALSDFTLLMAVNKDLEAKLDDTLTLLGKERDERGKWETEMMSKLYAAFHALRRLVDFVEVNLPDAYDDGHILTEAKDALSQIRGKDAR